MSHKNEPRAEPQRPATILVCDDDPDIAYLLALVLRDEGYGVYEETSAAAVLERLRGGLRPDLLVLDIKLGDQDVGVLLAQLRANGIVTPVLLMSARADVSLAVQQFGTQGGLSKPFTMGQIAHAVSDVLHTSRPWADQAPAGRRGEQGPPGERGDPGPRGERGEQGERAR